VTGLLDWEFAHAGERIEDLAWAEWIVRMHHTANIDDLESLFVAYGTRPTWSSRQAAMARHCEELLHFVETQGWPEAMDVWSRRIRTTEAWAE
jgi:aminoglycoside phosphotransferase (APT) family kinase protein